MKNFKKVIASLTSAAMVFGMVSLTPMSSVAAVTLPELTGSQYMIKSDSNDVQDFTGSPVSTQLFRFGGEGTSLDSFSVDTSAKKIYVENLRTGRIDFDAQNWTLVFRGTNNSVSGEFLVEGVAVDASSGTFVPYDSNILTIEVEEGASFTITQGGFVHIYDENYGIALASNTQASKSLTPTSGTYFEQEPNPLTGEIESVEHTATGIFGPITFTNKNSSTISDDEEETTSVDETDDSTTGDTTDKTDDATTDDTTTGDSSDDETTAGDSSDDETESPNVIEGKNLSWNTVDATGKSYWYENGVKQGTVDDPKAVSYDGAVRGREIYDPESMEWYWLDANSNGARAVSKEVFVPYIYQDQGNWTADDMMNNAKLSDGGLDGVGGTVYSAMINKTGKWIRYDAKGAMIKGWYTVEGAEAELYPAQKGNTYYYDTKTGTMAKGDCVIDGVLYHFDGLTGALKK